MSLTGTHHVFASVSQDGINTFLQAIFTARPHYLNYGSTFFVPANTASATNMSPIQFPGVPGGIQWAISFSIPVLGLYPDTSGGTSPLPPPPDGFNVHTQATIKIGCGTSGGDFAPNGEQLIPISTTLNVWATGGVVGTYFSPGNGIITFTVDQVLLPDVLPESLQALLDCLLRMILSAAIANLQLPFHAISLGALQLILEAGPTIANDQVEVWGSI